MTATWDLRGPSGCWLVEPGPCFKTHAVCCGLHFRAPPGAPNMSLSIPHPHALSYSSWRGVWLLSRRPVLGIKQCLHVRSSDQRARGFAGLEAQSRRSHRSHTSHQYCMCPASGARLGRLMAAHTGSPRGLAVALGPSITPQVESTAWPSCHRAGVFLALFKVVASVWCLPRSS